MSPVDPELFRECLKLLGRCQTHLEYCSKTDSALILLSDVRKFDRELVKRVTKGEKNV